MIKYSDSLLIILTVALVTIIIRFLPFVLFPEGKKPPKVITYLSNVLPCAVIGMLVIYCLKDITPLTYPYAIPEGIAIIIVVASYVWKRNTLVSILLGTLCYMIIIQGVF